MAELTTNPNDPDLGYGSNEEPVSQNKKYLVLPQEELAKGYVRPFRDTYVHARELGGCGETTKMGFDLSATYARDPSFYGATYCVGCCKHRPVGEHGEFLWTDGSKVGT